MDQQQCDYNQWLEEIQSEYDQSVVVAGAMPPKPEFKKRLCMCDPDSGFPVSCLYCVQFRNLYAVWWKLEERKEHIIGVKHPDLETVRNNCTWRADIQREQARQKRRLEEEQRQLLEEGGSGRDSMSLSPTSTRRPR